MRTLTPRHLALTGAALLALTGILGLWTTAWASDGRQTLARPTAEATADPDLASRVAALETQVAALQTAVATLQGTAASQPTPTPAAASVPVACGRPFASWGAATSDGINVQLLQLTPGTDAGPVIEGADVYTVEVALTNGRSDDLTYAPEDFALLGCDGAAYPALAGGAEPSVAEGSLGPGDATRGWLTFALAPGVQPAAFVYAIQSPGRSGAEVSCPLVDQNAPPAPLSAASGGAGCSARGGSAG